MCFPMQASGMAIKLLLAIAICFLCSNCLADSEDSGSLLLTGLTFFTGP